MENTLWRESNFYALYSQLSKIIAWIDHISLCLRPVSSAWPCSYTNLAKVIYRGSDLEQTISVGRDLQWSVSSCLTSSRLTRSSSLILRMLSKCLKCWQAWDIDQDTSPGSPFQSLTALLVKNCFLMFRLNLPWHSFELFPCILSLDLTERRPGRHLTPGIENSAICSVTLWKIYK